jgi:hypothetical protein
MRDFSKSGLRNLAKALAKKLSIENEVIHRAKFMTSSLPDVNGPLIGDQDIIQDMDSPADRLKKAREAAGYDSASAAARALGSSSRPT